MPLNHDPSLRVAKVSPIEKSQDVNNHFGTPAGKLRPGKPGPFAYRGAIAEIGAGQEVARLFFEALGTSRAIVKTMSAFGKACSDAVYGGVAHYISEERLQQMIDHDYVLLAMRPLDRIKEWQADGNDEVENPRPVRFFCFANTVNIDRDGWAGLRVQVRGDARDAGTTGNDCDHVIDYAIHYNLLSRNKGEKIRIAGCLGINLIHAALKHTEEFLNADDAKSPKANGALEDLVNALMDNITFADIRIDSVAIHEKLLDIKESPDSKCPFQLLNQEKYNSFSRRAGIYLAKSLALRCAFFVSNRSAAIPAYRAFNYLKSDPDSKTNKMPPLVITSSVCDDADLKCERAMLKAAVKQFSYDHKLNNQLLYTAIQIPIVGLVDEPEALLEKPGYDYERPGQLASDISTRKRLLSGAKVDDLEARVERILLHLENDGNPTVAILSDFYSQSLMIKYLREKTRYQPISRASENEPPNIAYVFRVDQYLELLLSMKLHVLDRHPLEILGSVMRRGAMFYVYPCKGKYICKRTFQKALCDKDGFAIATEQITLEGAFDNSFADFEREHGEFPVGMRIVEQYLTAENRKYCEAMRNEHKLRDIPSIYVPEGAHGCTEGEAPRF